MPRMSRGSTGANYRLQIVPLPCVNSAVNRLALILALILFVAFARDVTGRTSVIESDTIQIHGTRIRPHGIDAPQSGQSCRTRTGKTWRCGQKAALALSDKIGPCTVSRNGKATDNCQSGFMRAV